MGAGADWPCGNTRIITSNLDREEKGAQPLLSRPEAFFQMSQFLFCFFHWRFVLSLRDEPAILCEPCNLFCCISVKANGHRAVIPSVLLVCCTLL